MIRHRTLFNGDANFLFASPVYKTPHSGDPGAFLDEWIALLAASGVDTYLCNPNAQLPWYPSRATPHILTGYRRGDLEFVRGHFPPANDTDFPPAALEQSCQRLVQMLDGLLDLQEAGIDWVARIASACARHGIAPWASVRMNDMHGSNSWSASFMNCPPQRDPALRLSGASLYPGQPASPKLQTMSYDHPQTRAFMLEMIAELIADYPFEGLELDWMRTPFCCEAPASEATLRTMTEWLAQIRELTQAKARQCGKPFPLGLRTPVRIDLLRQIGLDIREYARLGLVDFIIPTNYFQSTWDIPYPELRAALGPGVALYGSIEAVPNWLRVSSPGLGKQMERLQPACPELLRGNAAGKLACGVEGLEFFNYFVADEARRHPYEDKTRRGADYPALRGLAELESLRGLPKQYVLSSSIGGHQFPFWEYAEALPMVLGAGEKRAFRLAMCAEPEGSGLRVVIQIVIKPGPGEAPAAGAIGVSLNGSWPIFASTPTRVLLFACGDYTEHLPEHLAFEFILPASLVKEGWNEILLFHHPDHPAGLSIQSIEIALQLPTQP